MSRKRKSGKKQGKNLSGPSMAEQADRHRLYEASVQNTESEYEFVDQMFQKLRGRPARLLREDFCGTANMCCEWVRNNPDNVAIGVDIDEEVLGWGEQNRVAELSDEQKKHLTLHRANVLEVETGQVDVVLAMNFSYYLFKQRDAVRDYFRCVHETLVDDGVFFLDAFGGYESFKDEIREKTKYDGFTYIWDHARYNPIDGNMLCHIHFAFPDGSRMDEAFTYDWRLWTLPEIQEILREAGFSKVTVYWQGTDEDGDPNDEFLPATVGEADPGWICYLSAEK